MQALLKHRRFSRQLGNAPGPKGTRLLYKIGEQMQKNPLDTFLMLHQTYGDFVSCNWVGRPTLFLFDPGAIRQVLKDRHTRYTKGPDYDELRPLLGEGLLLSEGELWRRQRHVVAKEFHQPKLKAFRPVVEEEVRSLIQSWAQKKERQEDVSLAMGHLTFRLATRLFFGMTPEADSERVKQSLEDESVRTNNRMRRLFNFPRSFPVQENVKGNRGIKYLNQLVYSIMQRPPAEGQNVLQRLREARDLEGRAMPENLIRDEVMTLMLAGHETTSAALTWSLYLLACHPEWQEKIRQDQEEGPMARACLLESMRLYPPAAVIARMVKEQDEIMGHSIPIGVSIVMAQWATHRHPKYWEAPLEFRPERFFPGAPAVDEYVYFPFARGARSCIGEDLAMMEAEIILKALVRAFSFKVPKGFAPVPGHHITLRSKNGMPLDLRLI